MLVIILENYWIFKLSYINYGQGLCVSVWGPVYHVVITPDNIIHFPILFYFSPPTPLRPLPVAADTVPVLVSSVIYYEILWWNVPLIIHPFRRVHISQTFLVHNRSHIDFLHYLFTRVLLSGHSTLNPSALVVILYRDTQQQRNAFA